MNDSHWRARTETTLLATGQLENRIVAACPVLLLDEPVTMMARKHYWKRCSTPGGDTYHRVHRFALHLMFPSVWKRSSENVTEALHRSLDKIGLKLSPHALWTVHKDTIRGENGAVPITFYGVPIYDAPPIAPPLDPEYENVRPQEVLGLQAYVQSPRYHEEISERYARMKRIYRTTANHPDPADRPWAAQRALDALASQVQSKAMPPLRTTE